MRTLRIILQLSISLCVVGLSSKVNIGNLTKTAIKSNPEPLAGDDVMMCQCESVEMCSRSDETLSGDLVDETESRPW